MSTKEKIKAHVAELVSQGVPAAWYLDDAGYHLRIGEDSRAIPTASAIEAFFIGVAFAWSAVDLSAEDRAL